MRNEAWNPYEAEQNEELRSVGSIGGLEEIQLFLNWRKHDDEKDKISLLSPVSASMGKVKETQGGSDEQNNACILTYCIYLLIM